MASTPYDQMKGYSVDFLGFALIWAPVRVRRPNMNRCVLPILHDAFFEPFERILVTPIFTPIGSNHIDDLRRIDPKLVNSPRSSIIACACR